MSVLISITNRSASPAGRSHPISPPPLPPHPPAVLPSSTKMTTVLEKSVKFCSPPVQSSIIISVYKKKSPGTRILHLQFPRRRRSTYTYISILTVIIIYVVFYIIIYNILYYTYIIGDRIMGFFATV